MKTVTLHGFIHARNSEFWERAEKGKHVFTWNAWEQWDGSKMIRPMSIEFEVPDDLDCTAEAIAELHARKAEVFAKAQAECNHYDDRIAKLQALTYEPATLED